MKIYYLQNENKEISQDGFKKFDDNCLEIERENYHIRNGYNGALFFEEYMRTDEYKAKESAFKAQQFLYELRRRRETECFSIINRGAIWYERLNATQKEELRAWYNLWLDVTKTLAPPQKPTWLEEF